MSETLYHLGCKVGDVCTIGVLFGDPDRCRLVHPLVDSFSPVSHSRGYILFNAKLGNLEITYGGLGIGGPSWSIALHELQQAGMEDFIRVGTAGIIGSKIRPGTLVVPTKVVADDGTARRIIDAEFLEPHADLTSLLLKYQKGNNLVSGLTHCKDFLYMEDGRGYPRSEEYAVRMKEVTALGALVTEMECGTLFAFGRARNVRTAAILAAINECRVFSLQTQTNAVEHVLSTLRREYG